MAEWTLERKKQFAKLVFGKNRVEFGETLFESELVIYRRTKLNKHEDEWEIEAIDLFTLDALFEWAVPLTIRKIIPSLTLDIDRAYELLLTWWRTNIKQGQTPALALAEAIEKALVG